MNFIINEIEKTHSLSPEENSFLTMFSNFFIKNNSNYLNFDLNNENLYQKYLSIKKSPLIVKNNEKLENISESAALFVTYLKNKKRIILITDSDLDGTSSRAIATSFDLYFKRKYKYKYIFEQYFANGHTHGICFSQIDTLLGDDIYSDALIVTADNGINNKAEIQLIKDKYPNVKIIVTDHHLANKGEDVFDCADYVINPEAIALNEKSKITQIDVYGNNVKTSFSGAHTFYFFILEILEQLNISNNELELELLLIALFSDIGDIINFGPDVLGLLINNIESFKNVSFIKNYIHNLDSFNQFPDEGFDYKVNEYLSKVITLLNSTRRTNSILLEYNNNSIEGFSKWLDEKFGFDVNEDYIILNKKTNEKRKILELLEEINTKSKKIYENFFPNNENRFNIKEKVQFNYSYIKEMPVLLLLSEDLNKSKNDIYFLEEAFSIMKKMDRIKNSFRSFIIEKELYETKKFQLFETYFSKKDGVLREILSVQAFIENDQRKSYLTLAQNQNNVINGSLRSKSIDFKDLFNNHEATQKLKEKYDLKIDIFGHTAAAGIFFNKKDITYDILINFLQDFEDILINEGHVLMDLDLDELNPRTLLNVDSSKMLDIIKNYFIIGPNSLFKEFKTIINGSDLLNTFGDKVKLLTAKSGTKYMNIRDENGNVYLFFPDEEDVDFMNLKFTTNVNFKFNSRSGEFYMEFILNTI